MLSQEFNKPVIEKFIRRKVYASFKGNIWAADLAEVGSLSSKNQGVQYFLCAQMFSPSLQKTNLHGFIGIVNESKRIPNKLRVDQRRDTFITFYKNG